MAGFVMMVVWIIIYLLILVGLVWWVVQWAIATDRRRSSGQPATPPAQQWTMCDSCGGGNFPAATHCQWCAAQLPAPSQVSAPQPHEDVTGD